MQLKRFTNEEISDSNNTCGIDFDGRSRRADIRG